MKKVFALYFLLILISKISESVVSAKLIKVSLSNLAKFTDAIEQCSTIVNKNWSYFNPIIGTNLYFIVSLASNNQYICYYPDPNVHSTIVVSNTTKFMRTYISIPNIVLFSVPSGEAMPQNVKDYYLDNMKSSGNKILLPTKSVNSSVVHKSNFLADSSLKLGDLFNNIRLEFFETINSSKFAGYISFSIHHNNHLEDWFRFENVQEMSPWKLSNYNKNSFNYFSISGTHNRVFFINNRYNGCDGDQGLFVVTTRPTCFWEGTTRNIRYAYSEKDAFPNWKNHAKQLSHFQFIGKFKENTKMFIMK